MQEAFTYRSDVLGHKIAALNKASEKQYLNSVYTKASLNILSLWL